MAFQNNPSPTSKFNLDKAKLEFASFLIEATDKKLLKDQDINFYMKANKLDTLLARELKASYVPSKSIRLKISKDVYSNNPVKILQTFKTHLSNNELDTSKTISPYCSSDFIQGTMENGGICVE